MSEEEIKSNIEQDLASLEFFDPNKPEEVEKAVAEANSIKLCLIKQAKLHSILNTSVEVNAKKLIEIMFNRFHLTDFDNLLNELIAVSPSPIEPMRMDSQE